jgi:hypothetical protein
MHLWLDAQSAVVVQETGGSTVSIVRPFWKAASYTAADANPVVVGRFSGSPKSESSSVQGVQSGP